MRRPYLAIGIVVVLAGIIAVALVLAPVFTASEKPSGTSITKPNEVAAWALGFVAPPYEDDYGIIRTSGYVDNRGKQDISQANILISLYDAQGNRKEQINYAVKDIPAGQRRTFDTSAGTFQGPRSAQIKVVSVVVK